MGRRGRKTPNRRESKKGSARQAPQSEHAPRSRVVHHPLYGDVPLVPEYPSLPDGSVGEPFWVPDPRFRPRRPSNAVPGDLAKQEYCSLHHLPKYFYVDENRVCAQCGDPFVFTATEQKFWYETLRFHFSSTAIRCRRCRRQRRNGSALNQQLSAAVQLAEDQPDDPVALVTLARATAEFFHHFRAGKLDRGVAAARRAQKLAPSLYEALYWEAACQELAGRPRKAAALYAAFVDSAPRTRRYRSMVDTARQRSEHAET